MTIPAELRKELGITTGTVMRLRIEYGGIILHKKEPVREIRGILKGTRYKFERKHEKDKMVSIGKRRILRNVRVVSLKETKGMMPGLDTEELRDEKDRV